MHRARGLFVVLATALLMVACGGSDNDSDDFQLNGIYPVEVSGIEQGVPFQAVGRMNLSTDSATSMVSGTFIFDSPPPNTLVSGEVSGSIDGVNFDFVLDPEIPTSQCGADYQGVALIFNFQDFSGKFSGGCIGQQITADFATTKRTIRETIEP